MIRSCQSCGTESRWSQLPYVGIQKVIDDADLELRNCHCGSTLAEELTQSEAEAWALICCQTGVPGAVQVVASLNYGMPLGHEGRAWLCETMLGDEPAARWAEVLYDRLVGEL